MQAAKSPVRQETECPICHGHAFETRNAGGFIYTCSHCENFKITDSAFEKWLDFVRTDADRTRLHEKLHSLKTNVWWHIPIINLKFLIDLFPHRHQP